MQLASINSLLTQKLIKVILVDEHPQTILAALLRLWVYFSDYLTVAALLIIARDTPCQYSSVLQFSMLGVRGVLAVSYILTQHIGFLSVVKLLQLAFVVAVSNCSSLFQILVCILELFCAWIFALSRQTRVSQFDSRLSPWNLATKSCIFLVIRELILFWFNRLPTQNLFAITAALIAIFWWLDFNDSIYHSQFRNALLLGNLQLTTLLGVVIFTNLPPISLLLSSLIGLIICVVAWLLLRRQEQSLDPRIPSPFDQQLDCFHYLIGLRKLSFGNDYLAMRTYCRNHQDTCTSLSSCSLHMPLQWDQKAISNAQRQAFFDFYARLVRSWAQVSPLIRSYQLYALLQIQISDSDNTFTQIRERWRETKSINSPQVQKRQYLQNVMQLIQARKDFWDKFEYDRLLVDFLADIVQKNSQLQTKVKSFLPKEDIVSADASLSKKQLRQLINQDQLSKVLPSNRVQDVPLLTLSAQRNQLSYIISTNAAARRLLRSIDARLKHRAIKQLLPEPLGDWFQQSLERQVSSPYDSSAALEESIPYLPFLTSNGYCELARVSKRLVLCPDGSKQWSIRMDPMETNRSYVIPSGHLFVDNDCRIISCTESCRLHGISLSELNKSRQMLRKIEQLIQKGSTTLSIEGQLATCLELHLVDSYLRQGLPMHHLISINQNVSVHQTDLNRSAISLKPHQLDRSKQFTSKSKQFDFQFYYGVDRNQFPMISTEKSKLKPIQFPVVTKTPLHFEEIFEMRLFRGTLDFVENMQVNEQFQSKPESVVKSVELTEEITEGRLEEGLQRKRNDLWVKLVITLVTLLAACLLGLTIYSQLVLSNSMNSRASIASTLKVALTQMRLEMCFGQTVVIPKLRMQESFSKARLQFSKKIAANYQRLSSQDPTTERLVASSQLATIMREISLLSSAFEGSQSDDLAVRVLTKTSKDVSSNWYNLIITLVSLSIQQSNSLGVSYNLACTIIIVLAVLLSFVGVWIVIRGWNELSQLLRILATLPHETFVREQIQLSLLKVGLSGRNTHLQSFEQDITSLNRQDSAQAPKRIIYPLKRAFLSVSLISVVLGCVAAANFINISNEKASTEGALLIYQYSGKLGLLLTSLQSLTLQDSLKLFNSPNVNQDYKQQLTTTVKAYDQLVGLFGTLFNRFSMYQASKHTIRLWYDPECTANNMCQIGKSFGFQNSLNYLIRQLNKEHPSRTNMAQITFRKLSASQQSLYDDALGLFDQALTPKSIPIGLWGLIISEIALVGVVILLSYRQHHKLINIRQCLRWVDIQLLAQNHLFKDYYHRYLRRLA